MNGAEAAEMAGRIPDSISILVKELNNPFFRFRRDVDFMVNRGYELLGLKQIKDYVPYGLGLFMMLRESKTREGMYTRLLKRESKRLGDILSQMAKSLPDYISTDFYTLIDGLENIGAAGDLNEQKAV